jgi:hypothetical protein
MANRDRSVADAADVCGRGEQPATAREAASQRLSAARAVLFPWGVLR